MTLPASDAFGGSDGQALTAYSSNWTNNVGAFKIQSGGLYTDYASGDAAAHWNADTFGNDQYAQATVVAITNTAYIGVAVRCAASGGTFYSFTANNDAWYLSKYVSGSYTDLGSGGWGVGFAVNDVIRLEAEGTTIRAKINGTTVVSVTDSGISSGYAGVGGSGNVTGSRIDSWSAGNIGSSAQTITPSGIASGEAFGSATLAPGAVTVAPSGIASGEAFGATTVGAAAAGQTISPTGIASAEAFGTATVAPGTAAIAPAGVASAFATGTTELLMAACIGGVLQEDPDNPRYFRNTAGIVPLMGNQTWYALSDAWPGGVETTFSYQSWLDYCATRGTNFFKLWAMRTARDWPDEAGTVFTPLPWARTGPGNAADGGLKFDLGTWNQDYFDRLRQRAIEAGNRGFYVAIQFEQGWQADVKGLSPGNPITYHPYVAGNNINSISGNPDADADILETRDASSTTFLDLHKALIRKIVDTVNDLDNVLYEISNEETASATVRTWQHTLIDYTHTYEAGLAKQHPVGMTWMWPGGDNEDDLDTSNADWLSYGGNDSSPLASPVVWPTAGSGNRPSLWDTDHMGGIVYDDKYMWKAFCRGHNVAYMDEYDGTFGTDTRSDATVEKIRYNLGYILDYCARMDLRYTTPQGSLASTGYCLARLTGTAKLIAYQPSSGAFTVDLSSVSGTFSLEWLRPSTGATQAGSNVSGGAVRTLTPPWGSEDVVAFLELTELTIAPSGIASGAAFGTATLVPGAITISCTGIASAEAFGSASTQPGAVTVAPAGIASAEAHGAAAVQPGAVTVSPAAVPTGEAFGVVILAAGAVTIVADGIATAAAFGAALIQAGASYIAPTGIASGEAHGGAAIQPGAVSILATGIASGETHGETLLATGAVLQPTGIASGEAHGATTVQPGAVNIVASGIATAETFGTVALLVDLLVAAAGIATGEAFGTALLSVGGAFVQPAGIASGETFGDVVVLPGAVSILPAGIAGGEAFGTLRLVVAGADQYIDVPSVQAGEQFGIATLLMALIAERTFSVRAETRRYVVSAENRTYSVTR